MTVPAYGCVVLTQGNRPAELARGLDSLLAQQGASVDVAVVGNGWAPQGLPEGVHAVALPENVGIPAGRNAGVPHVRGELLFFLDDDAWLSGPTVLADIAARFGDDPTLGVLQPRIADPDGLRTPRQWVPRLRVGDPARSSDVCAVCEGALTVRRDLFERIGGWPECFFYAHEGVDLAWRAMDAGYRVHYAGDLVAHHAWVAPQRHATFHRLTSRNRVWLARRNLPLPLAAVYLGVWFVLTLARAGSRQARIEALRGFAEGARGTCGGRRPMRWRTAWRMTRVGRPPVI